MKTYLNILVLAFWPAAIAAGQFQPDPTSPPAGPPLRGEPPAADQPPQGGLPQGEPGQFGGPGPRGFVFGPRPNMMFTAIDVDGDGVITGRELRRAAAQLKKLDNDGDGNLTLEEVSGGGPMPFGDPAQFVDRFMQNDRNGDGKLTPEELPEFLRPVLEGADQNGDGADRAEITAHMQNMRNRFPGGPGGFGPGGPGGFRGPGVGAQAFDPNQMTGQLMQNDRNGDGRLTEDEVPRNARFMLRGADQNNDGVIELSEMQAHVRRMGDRGRAFGAGNGQQGDNDREGRGDRPRNRQRNRDEN